MGGIEMLMGGRGRFVFVVPLVLSLFCLDLMGQECYLSADGEDASTCGSVERPCASISYCLQLPRCNASQTCFIASTLEAINPINHDILVDDSFLPDRLSLSIPTWNLFNQGKAFSIQRSNPLEFGFQGHIYNCNSSMIDIQGNVQVTLLFMIATSITGSFGSIHTSGPVNIIGPGQLSGSGSCLSISAPEVIVEVSLSFTGQPMSGICLETHRGQSYSLNMSVSESHGPNSQGAALFVTGSGLVRVNKFLMDSVTSNSSSVIVIEDFHGGLEMTQGLVSSQGLSLVSISRSSNVSISNWRINFFYLQPGVEVLGMIISIRDSSQVFINNCQFFSTVNDLAYGAIAIVHSDQVYVEDCLFDRNQAQLGPSLWCQDGSTGTHLRNVSFSNQTTTNLFGANLPIGSDHSCASNVWWLPSECMTNCSSCAGLVCDQGSSNAPECHCYCTGDDQLPCLARAPTISFSRSRSASGSSSHSVSASPSGSISPAALSHSSDDSSWVWIVSGVIIVGLIGMVVVGAFLGGIYFFRHGNKFHVHLHNQDDEGL